jgi:hypothetical protein
VTVTFRTVAFEVPTTLAGLLPGRIVVEHSCNLCRARVATADLADHARAHDHKEVSARD